MDLSKDSVRSASLHVTSQNKLIRQRAYSGNCGVQFFHNVIVFSFGCFSILSPFFPEDATHTIKIVLTIRADGYLSYTLQLLLEQLISLTVLIWIILLTVKKRPRTVLSCKNMNCQGDLSFVMMSQMSHDCRKSWLVTFLS